MAERVRVLFAVTLLVASLGGVGAWADPSPVTVAPAQSDSESAAAVPPEDRQGASESMLAASISWDREMAHRCPPGSVSVIFWECVGQPLDSFADTLTQDWAGFRTFLNAIGIAPTASYISQLMGNPIGGRTRGFTYAGALSGVVSWDLEKLLGVPGLSFVVGAAWPTGKSLSTEDIGNVFFVQSAFAGTGAVSLQQMYFQQDLFDGDLSIAAGRLAPANTFATLPIFNNYLSGGINPIHGSLAYNDPSFAQSPPGVEWGAQIVYNPILPLQISVGVYNTNPFSASGADHGVDFSLQQGNSGVLTVFQINYRLNQAKGDAGLPGEYAIGGFYDSNAFASLNPPPANVRGNYAIYAMFQQMVYRDGPPLSKRGLTIWGDVAVSPKQSASLIPFLVAGGLSYRGLLPSRDRDIASVGVVSGIFSRHVSGASAETVVEVNYQAALPFGLSITPDVQYVIRPSGSSRIPNALVLGLQIAANF